MKRRGTGIVVVFVFLGAVTGLAASAFEIRGKVVGREGAALAGAKAWLVQQHEALHAETDASGTFVIAGARTGLAHLVVWKDGYALGGHTGVVVGPETFTFKLGSPASLQLRVIDYAYRPVHGARLSSLVVNEDIVIPVGDLADSGFPSARSDEQGLLLFSGLPERCTVEARVAHREYVESQLPLLPVSGETWTVQLRPGKVLRGRVVNEAGKGVGHGLVSVLDVGQDEHGERLETRTDPEGFFWLKVMPGVYDVGVKHGEYAAAVPKRVEVEPASQEKAVDLTLPPPRQLHGRVVFPDDTPGVGVWVAYFLEMGLYEERVTDANGAFRMSVCPGPGTLRIYPPDGFLVRGGHEIAVDVQADDLRIPKIRLQSLPEIEGVVVRPDGAPEPNTLISSLDCDPPIWLITDPEGRFRIQLDRAPTGKARFRAEQALRFLRCDFEADLSSPPKLEIHLKPFEPDLSTRQGEGLTRGLGDLMGTTAPELKCDTWFNVVQAEGETFKPPVLRDMQGNIVVLTFWSGVDITGTGRERVEELRALDDLLRFSGTDDVVILGIHDNMTSPEGIRDYLQQYRIGFPVGRDLSTGSTFERYRIRSIPQTVLIDRSGKLRYFSVEGRLLELIKLLRREADATP